MTGKNSTQIFFWRISEEKPPHYWILLLCSTLVNWYASIWFFLGGIKKCFYSCWWKEFSWEMSRVLSSSMLTWNQLAGPSLFLFHVASTNHINKKVSQSIPGNDEGTPRWTLGLPTETWLWYMNLIGCISREFIADLMVCLLSIRSYLIKTLLP